MKRNTMLLVALFVTAVVTSSVEGSGFIRGHRSTSYSTWPWMVAILKVNKDNSLTNVCGGSLISREHVLTAASCIEPNATYRLRLGQVDLSETWNQFQFQEFNIERVVTHAEYFNSTNDVALITMSGRANINGHVQVIDLAPQCFNFTGLQVAVAGWGQTTPQPGSSTSRLQYVSLLAMSPAECERAIRGSVRPANDRRKNYLRDYLVCAKSLPGNGGNICYGDFGGPLVYRYPNTVRPVLVGIASAVYHNCTDLWFPSLYTKVSAYRSWIEQHMKN